MQPSSFIYILSQAPFTMAELNSSAVTNLFGTRDRLQGRRDDGSGGDASDRERWGGADEASLACPPSPPTVQPGS